MYGVFRIKQSRIILKKKVLDRQGKISRSKSYPISGRNLVYFSLLVLETKKSILPKIGTF